MQRGPTTLKPAVRGAAVTTNFGELRYGEVHRRPNMRSSPTVQLPNTLRHQGLCAPSSTSPTGGWKSVLSGSSSTVSAASGGFCGASSSGTLAARAALAWVSCAMIVSARLLASLSASSCFESTFIVSSLADMSALGSPSSRGLVSVELPFTQTCTLPSGSFSDSNVPLLTRIRTASTDVPKTSAASCTVSRRLVTRTPPTGLPFGVMLALPEEARTRPLHGTCRPPENTRYCMLVCPTEGRRGTDIEPTVCLSGVKLR